MDAVEGVDRGELIEWLAAYVRHAHESADMVAACLKQWQRDLGLDPTGQYPPLFLVELGAILRIAHWQQSDALAPLAEEFPPACELLTALVDRLTDDPSTLFGQITVERCPLDESRRRSMASKLHLVRDARLRDGCAD